MKSITTFSLVVLAIITALVAPPFAASAAEEPKFENALRFHQAPAGIIAVGEQAVWQAADGEAFKLVAQPAGYFSGSVVGGHWLVVATSTGLHGFALDGKWKTTFLPLEGWGTVLGSNGAKVIALDQAGNQYTLQADGTWKKEKRFLKGSVTHLIGRGDQWAAVGREPAESTDSGDNEPRPKFWMSSGLLTWTETLPDRYAEVKFAIHGLVVNENGLLACDWKGNVFRSESGARWFQCELPPLKDFYGRSVHAAEGRFYIVESGPNVPTKLRVSTTGKEWKEWFIADNLLIRNWVHGAAPTRLFVRDTKTNAHRVARLAECAAETAPLVVAQTKPVAPPPPAGSPPPSSAPIPTAVNQDLRKEIAHGFEIGFGRQPDEGETAYFLKKGLTSKEAVAEALAQALELPVNAKENARIVAACFRTLLRRNPTQAELAQWLAKPPKIFRARAREIAATFPSYADYLADPDNVPAFADTSRLEMKIEMGMSDAEIDRFLQQRDQDSKQLHADLRRQGISADDVGKAMNDGITAVARDMTKDAAAPVNQKQEALVAAWKKFDKAMGAAQPAGYPAPVAEMLAALRANADAAPFVPVLGDTFCDTAGQLVEALSGLDGYLKLVLAVGDKDYGALAKRLPAAKKELLREAAGAYAGNAAYAQRNQPQIAKGPDQKKVAAIWPVNQLPAIKPQTRPWFDLSVVRRRLAQGERGAAFDLYAAHDFGYGTPVNAGLAALYYQLGTVLGAVPSGDVDPNNAAQMKQLADAGSAWAMLAWGKIQLAQSVNSTNRAVAVPAAQQWLERSYAGGYLAAAIELGTFYSDGKVVPADEAAANLWYARGGVQPPAKPKILTAEERRQIVVLLEKFERRMLATRDREAMATAVAELIAELQPKMPVEKFASFSTGAFRYVGSNCGFRGLAQYVNALPAQLQDEVVAKMGPDFRALFEKALPAVAAKRFDDPSVQEGVTRLPAPTPLQVEPMKSDSFNPAIARERLAAGDGGGALDLMLCYQHGRGTPVDLELRYFYTFITDAEFPAVAKQLRAGPMTTAEIAEADRKRGSAMALADYATPLFNAAKFKDEAKTKEALEMLVRAMKGGDKRAAQVIEEFKVEHERNKQALIADIRAQTVGPKGYMKSDVERKAEEIAKAVREGRFSDVFQAGKPSARYGYRTLWDLLSDAFGTPEQKLGVGYLTPRVEELAKEINPILKERELVFFGKEVFDATDPAKAEELMTCVLAQAAPRFQDQLRAVLDNIKKQNRPIKMSEAIIAAQQSEALRLLRVAERGDWRSIPKGKTAADVVAGNGFDAILDISTVRGITAESLTSLPAFTQGQIDGSVMLILGGQSFEIHTLVTVNYDHAGGRLELSGERMLQPAVRGKYGKIERQAEMDGRVNMTLNFKEDGTIYLVWAFHRGKNEKSVSLFDSIKKANKEPHSQTFVFVPVK